MNPPQQRHIARHEAGRVVIERNPEHRTPAEAFDQALAGVLSAHQVPAWGRALIDTLRHTGQPAGSPQDPPW